jgi:uncharacterized protein (TIGR03435 family)
MNSSAQFGGKGLGWKCCWLSMIALLTLPTHAFAQDITGTWQGTLKAAEDARLVIKISRRDSGLKAMVYKLDEPGPGVAADSIKLQGSMVEISLSALGGIYTGTLNPDGSSIKGTWASPQPSPIDLTRDVSNPSWTQFEVASIKPNNSGDRPLPSPLNCLPGGRFTATNVTLVDMIVRIYSASTRRIQMQGGPDWIDSERFDIVAEPDTSKGAIKPTQCTLMIQSLLEDRFKLVFHTETREMSVYALVKGKNPPKLQQAKQGETTDVLPGPQRQLNFHRMSMLGLVNTVSNILQMPVVDATGINGFFDFTLNPAQFAATGAVNSPLPPMGYGDLVVTAVQEELGFKFEKRKMPLEITIIDHAERPSQN